MRLRHALFAVSIVLAAAGCYAAQPDGNRLTYLDGSDPYYVGLKFPKLTTPQWVGEEGVEAVVVLAIDDMRKNSARYEDYLRPILDRLKAIDGRAPVSIMACEVVPEDPRLQDWLKEGLSIEVHTIAHPCPLLQKDDFDAAKKTVDDCIDLMHRVPHNRPVAFRMPCCDSINSPSPRFYAEIFNSRTREGHFLSIDSSVFQLFTPDDPALPRDLVLNADGSERFRRYIPFPSYVNKIENYPYPYVIGRLCWEFPCVIPSDWEAQHVQRPNNPRTVDDLKAALDAVVLKQGVFNLVFHPHGWIKSEQVVELIDHAVAKHGKKVKFLNFREAQERLDTNLLGGQSLRAPSNGQDNGVRLLDLNNDGYLDVAIANKTRRESRVWDPKAGRWQVGGFPEDLTGKTVRFGIDRPGGEAAMIVGHGARFSGWRFEGGRWVEAPSFAPPPIEFPTSVSGVDWGYLFRDLDGDGLSELLVANTRGSAILTRSKPDEPWRRAKATLPVGRWLPAGEIHGRDCGTRFVDVDEDGRDDLVFSDMAEYGVSLFDSMATGWTRRVLGGSAGQSNALPMIYHNLKNDGFWVQSRSLWWQNEATAKLPDLVDRRSFNELLKDVEPRARSPQASRDSIRVKPGFRVEIAASEPLVRDPIAFEWGADGKLWVVEMGDYPLGIDGKGKHGGVVRYLEDTDADGHYDKSTVFLDGLGFPTGLIPWRDGVIIGCAPDIFYAEDRDGDGKADHREVLFTGFREGNQQHRLNGFDLGLDGWVYGANGDSGGAIKSLKTGKEVVINGRDFRFRPDDGRFEAENGPTQYGRHRDDWGHWFGNNNPTWAWHYVFADADLRGNSQFAPPDPRKILEPDTKLYPISRTLPRFNSPDAANRVTSANSPTPYRDDLFGPHFENSLFVSEPVHNVVHRIVLEPDGPTFKGRRGPDEADREFFASSDNWTRPTMLKTGPDGALWVADMYRAVIEHPEWIPDDWEAKLDLRAGSEQGRIYRIVPVDKQPRPIPRLDRLDTAGLVAALDSPSGWQRDTAERLLLHKNDPAAIEPLRRLARDTKRAKTRVQALWTLEALGKPEEEAVAQALADPDPRVRRNALRSGEALLAGAPRVAEAALKLADDPDAAVRMQLALSLGRWDDPRAGKALATLARRDAADPYLRAAILSAAPRHVGTLLAALFADPKEEPPASIVAPLFALTYDAKSRAAFNTLLDLVATPNGSFAPWQFAALAGLLDANERGRRHFTDDENARFDRLRQAARSGAADPKATEDARLAALRVLGRDPKSRGDDRDALAGLLRPQVPSSVQQAAITALGRVADPKVPAVLLDGWRGYSPTLRSAALDTLLSREAWTAALLSSLEDTCTPASEIDPAHRRRLLDHPVAALKERAEAVFRGATGTREAVVAQYRPALKLKGDPSAGAAVFKKLCITCHKLGNEGAEVGPDLAALTDRSPEALLVAILDPNRAFEAKYTNFTVHTTDGRVLTGLIAVETGASVTLRRQEGKEDVLLRSDIEALAGSGQSVMPEGLEKDLSPQAFADLIAYLNTTGPPPKRLDGNRPETVKPKGDGTLALRAASAEVYGDTLIFESKYGNLGYWSRPNDRARWKFDVARPGRYAVWLDWACDDGTAGNPLVLDFGPERLAHRVAGTGNWDTYRTAKIGEVTLGDGPGQLEVRSEGKIKGALIDLRAVELRPVSAGAPCCEP